MCFGYVIYFGETREAKCKPITTELNNPLFIKQLISTTVIANIPRNLSVKKTDNPAQACLPDVSSPYFLEFAVQGALGNPRLFVGTAAAWSVCGCRDSRAGDGAALRTEGSSAWVQVQPGVPEAGNRAMLLAGLGLVGFSVRRRRQRGI